MRMKPSKEKRIIGKSLAAALALVGGLSLGLSTLIAEEAAWYVVPTAILAGVAAILLAIAVWRLSGWMRGLYALWAVVTVVFHVAYQAGAGETTWKRFLIGEALLVLVMLFAWRYLIAGFLRRE